MSAATGRTTSTQVTVVDPGEPFEAEYLYWVGCAGSFDDKNKKVTQAMAKLLTRAGIDVAILGPSEMCTGDSARRSGNEYLFQMLAMPNIEMLDGMGVKKIITQCPHCFNTLMNEYPQLGGNYEVVHHTQLLEQLIDRGPARRQPGLARGTDHLPRLVLPRPPQRRVPRTRARSSVRSRGSRSSRWSATAPRACAAAPAAPACGWRRTIGVKVNDERAEEAISTGATRVATACPFCYVMLDDGVKAAGKDDDEVKVADLAIHLLDAIEAGEEAAAHPDAPLNVPMTEPVKGLAAYGVMGPELGDEVPKPCGWRCIACVGMIGSKAAKSDGSAICA